MRLVLALVMALALPLAGVAQETDLRAGILVLDQERFFSQSLFGQRVQAEIDAAGQSLAAENRGIEAELTAEEQDLDARRADMTRAEFSVLAAEFDARVERIRTEQDAKTRVLSGAAESARQQFFELAVPILLEIAAERNAAAILDRRSVLLAAGAVDITDVAIASVDETLGTGPEGPLFDLDATTPEPEPDE